MYFSTSSVNHFFLSEITYLIDEAWCSAFLAIYHEKKRMNDDWGLRMDLSKVKGRVPGRVWEGVGVGRCRVSGEERQKWWFFQKWLLFEMFFWIFFLSFFRKNLMDPPPPPHFFFSLRE